MSRILAIDPGSVQSAHVVLDAAGSVIDHEKSNNEGLLDWLRHRPHWVAGNEPPFDIAVIEWTAPRGMPASAQLFETMWWAGRFAEALAQKGYPVERLERATVKLHLCGSRAAKDSNVHAALVDRYGGIGGKAAAVGLKAAPGPLYGITQDQWAALAVAVAWQDGAR